MAAVVAATGWLLPRPLRRIDGRIHRAAAAKTAAAKRRLDWTRSVGAPDRHDRGNELCADDIRCHVDAESAGSDVLCRRTGAGVRTQQWGGRIAPAAPLCVTEPVDASRRVAARSGGR